MNLKLNHSTEDEVLMCVATPVDTRQVHVHVHMCSDWNNYAYSNELFVIIVKYDTELIQRHKSAIQFLRVVFVCCFVLFVNCLNTYYQ